MADDDDELRDIADSLGWDSDSFIAYIHPEEAGQAFNTSIQKAINKGVFGVPTVMLGEEMWWGNDRLDFLEETLQQKA